MKSISGVVPIVPTPFVPGSEAVDAAALRRLVDFAVDAEAAAICLPAYGSEFYKLTEPERLEVVEVAVDQAAGRLPLMAQCNHGSAKGAAELARRNADIGAEVISFALPRQFPLTDDDQFEYARAVCDAVGTPVLIQDWNPSGSSVGADFCARLADVCPNFRYIKLEEPRMGPKVRAVIEATGGRVEVFEGWGGLYMLELVPTGIVGIMPGLALTDRLAPAWRMAVAGQAAEALAAFEPLVPWLAFGLSDMEFFNALEKRLLAARGLLEHPTLRNPTVTIDEDSLAYADFLIGRLLQCA